MASFIHKPILAVVYISSIFLTVSSIDTSTDTCPCSVAGPPGAAGIPGFPGNHGLTGAQGPVGASGAKGNRGYGGHDGDTGPAGPDGVSGPKGDTGDNGLDGTNGAPGLKGDQGSTGNQGSPGTPYIPPPIVAFVAHRTTTFQVTTGNKIIDFQTMKLNIGDDFSPTSGVFTCRIPGLYYFAFNLFPLGPGDYIHVYLEHNGSKMAYLQIYGSTNYYAAYSTSSLSTILALNKDDEVLLRAIPNTEIVGSNDGLSTFTGYLLQDTTPAFISNLSSE